LFLSSLEVGAAARAVAAPCVNSGGTDGCYTSVQAAVNAARRGDVIAIAAGTYIGPVIVDRSVTLRGADRATTILDGGAAGSVVTTLPHFTVALSDLTIQNGTGTPGPNGGRGGGILGAGRLTLTNVTVQENSAACGSSCGEGGGGIFFGDRNGRLTLIGSTVRNNSSVYGGGMHLVAGSVRIVDSTIRDNSVGGITDVNSSGRVRLQINGSTITGNSGYYAGLTVFGHALIANSTISENTTDTGCTAGVDAEGGKTEISFSTIAGNTSAANCGGPGTGVQATGKVSLRGSIVASNTGALGESDCGGTLRSLGSNIVQDPATCTVLGKVAATLVADPDLGPLQDNGGPTETQAPLPASPALGVATQCPKTDQRGVPRSRHCDIGAVEN
jgi:hypothetical protein